MKNLLILDGPVYTTGALHIGTLYNKILKDFYIRLFNVLGYNVSYNIGWDEYGLPNEKFVKDQLLKYNNKPENPLDFSIICDQLITAQRAKMWRDVLKIKPLYNNQSQFWTTRSHTWLNKSWKFFYDQYNNNKIFKNFYVVDHCINCKTSLAISEIEYQQKLTKSLYFLYQITNTPYYAMLFTTTIWTVPLNETIGFSKNINYCIVDLEGKRVIIGANFARINRLKILIRHFDISKLTQQHYIEPFTKVQKQIYQVNFVEDNDYFTGFVHIVPAHGQCDFKVGKTQKLYLKSNITIDGKYTSGILKNYHIFHNDTHSKIIAKLKKAGLFVSTIDYNHKYPHCWRCKGALIKKTSMQWFYDISQYKDKILEQINNTVSTPYPFQKQQLIKHIKQRPLWCLSRQRIWGTPIPVWICNHCKKLEIFQSTRVLSKRVGYDLIYPYATYFDTIIYKCCCGGSFIRQSGILDVWLDSGLAAKMVQYQDKNYVRTIVIESVDQYRGWFNTLSFVGYAITKKVPFSDLLVHGYIMRGGKKYSKSVDKQGFFAKYNGDIDLIRHKLLTQINYKHFMFDLNIKQAKIIKNMIKNIENFFTYNNIPFTPEFHNIDFLKLEAIDRYFFDWFYKTYNIVKQAGEQLKNHIYTKKISRYMISFSRIYLKYIKGQIKPRKNLVSFLFYNLKILFAPIFTNLEVRNIKLPNHQYSDAILEEGQQVIRLIKTILKYRDNSRLNLKNIIYKVTIYHQDKKILEIFKHYESFIKKMCNLHILQLVEGLEKITYDLKTTKQTRAIDEKRAITRLIQLERKIRNIKPQKLVKIRTNNKGALNYHITNVQILYVKDLDTGLKYGGKYYCFE